ncbi:MAG: ABC transporter ATP-binding protein/permease [Gallionellaceae bacterium]|nr:ABC transporter ATP-binding protein/permease [Gallionellaceae bacterium]
MSALQKIRFILTHAERKSMVILLCLMVIGTMLEMLGVGILFPVMILMGQNDLATRYPRIQPLLEFLGNPTQSQLVIYSMLGLVGIYFIKNLFLAFLAWRQVRFASGIQVQLAQRLFTAYLRQPYTFHLQRNSAQLGHNITGEVAVFSAVINSGMSVFTEGMALLGITALLLLAEPIGVLIVALLLGAAVWSFHCITRARITRWGVARQHHDILRSHHMYQGLGGFKDVKLLGRESNFLAQFQLHSAQGARAAGSQSILQQLPRLWLELLAVAGLALLVLSMLGQGAGTERIVPTLGLFAAAAFRLIPSVNRILSGVQFMRYSLPSVNLLYEEVKFIAIEPAIIQQGNVSPHTAFQTEIRLSNISYAYPGTSTLSLDSVSISIRKGESVGFIGPSGSGKSTLVDVILGLLPPHNGQVIVDGQDIQKGLRAWQKQIGYVPQSIYLTDDTLRRNVAFGLPDEEINNAAVRRAIKGAQLEEFVTSLPKGLETVVGERGIRLSGGQRQRIGIARALYHDPSILVLDEATSALDTSSEQGVMQAVMTLHGSKTILIVAHRLSTVEHCDRLYRLEKGKVTAEGAPEKMLAPNKTGALV